MKSVKAGFFSNLLTGQIWDREALMADLWRTLDNQSVYFTGERRMGKTSVINKMRADPASGKRMIYLDVEDAASASDFALLVYRKVTEAQPGLLRARGALARGFKRRFGISKLKVGTVNVEFADLTKSRWPEVLDEVAVALQKESDLHVLCLDELPQLLQNIIGRGEPHEARQLLDKLRELRQTYLRVRMIYTGSIGLHHVEAQLLDLGSAWAPINDMKKIDIPPFSNDDATSLAHALLTNEGVRCDDLPSVAAAVATQSDAIPYYIHLMVDALLRRNVVVGVKDVDEVIDGALNDPDDAWGFRHQVRRVPEYYKDDADLAYALLDIISREPGLSFDEILVRVSAGDLVDSRDGNKIRALMELLERDHYVTGANGKFRFRRTLMGRAWKAKRYLA